MSKIQWTDATWNPILGCRHASRGCDNCYAEPQATRVNRMMRARGGAPRYLKIVDDESKRWTGESRFVPSELQKPRQWRTGRKVFVCSMSDLFYEKHNRADIERVFDVMRDNTHHTYQILTKRAGLMSTMIDQIYADTAYIPWWCGASVAFHPKDIDADIERVRQVTQTPAGVRWLSIEPLLGPIPQRFDLNGIDWVVIGGESGPRAREMREEWAREIVAMADRFRIPVFVKQMGSVWACKHSVTRKGDNPSEWLVDLRRQEFPR